MLLGWFLRISSQGLTTGGWTRFTSGRFFRTVA